MGQLIGRQAELAAIARRFSEGARLVTVTGAAGIGKTRLARAFVERVEGERWWFVDVAGARTPLELTMTVVQALAADFEPLEPERPDQLMTLTLSRLAPLGLVVDNAESMPPASRALLQTWCEQVPDLRLLVTSRSRLQLRDEQLLDLRPLAVTSPDDGSQISEAAALFLDRMGSLGLPAPTDPALLVAVGEIGRALDGLPLALVLAASRTRVLSVAQILDRLRHRFELLRVSESSGETRYSSLQAALDSCWSRLSAVEREALRQCAVFQGPFDIEAAERVLDWSHLAPQEHVLDVLSGLRDQSMLEAEPSSSDGGPTWLRVLESVREYVAAQYATEALDPALQRRHTAYLAELAQRVVGPGPRSPAASALLAVRREDLQQALRWAAEPTAAEPLAAERADLGLWMALGLAHLLEAWALLPDAVTTCSSAVEAFADRVVDRELLARLLHTRGRLRAGLGQWDATVDDIERLRLLAEDQELAIARGGALDLEARQALAHGRHGPAAELAERAARALTEAGDSAMLGWVVETRGSALFNLGRYAESREAYARAAQMAREQGDAYRDLLYLRNHAVATAALGDPADAGRQLQALLSSARKARLTLLEGMIEVGLALHHLDRREYGPARQAAQRAFDTHCRGGMLWVAANAALTLGRVAGDQGRLDEARRGLRDFLSIDRAAQLRESARASLTCDLAYCEALRGDCAAALAQLEPLCEGPRQVRGPIARVLVWAASGIVHLLNDEPERAVRAHAELDRLRPSDIFSGNADEVRCQGIFAHLAQAEVARRAGRGEEAAEQRAAALDRLRWGLAPGPVSDDYPWGAPGILLRSATARRTLRFALALLGDEQVRSAQTEALSELHHMLVVGPEGTWFRVAGGSKVDLTRHANLARLLEHLAARRTTHPNEPSPTHELIAAGWPGQRMVGDAGAKRVYVALHTLRTLGLREVLKHDPDGYWIDPKVPLLRCP